MDFFFISPHTTTDFYLSSENDVSISQHATALFLPTTAIFYFFPDNSWFLFSLTTAVFIALKTTVGFINFPKTTAVLCFPSQGLNVIIFHTTVVSSISSQTPVVFPSSQTSVNKVNWLTISNLDHDSCDTTVLVRRWALIWRRISFSWLKQLIFHPSWLWKLFTSSA